MPIEQVITCAENGEATLDIWTVQDEDLYELRICVPYGYDAKIWIDDQDMEMLISRWKRIKMERELQKQKMNEQNT